MTVLVGGLGLGYTAREALASDRVGSVLVVELLPQVIDWLEKGWVPLADELKADSRFTVMEGGPERFRTTAEMKQVAAAFNRGKGEATVSFANDGKAVIIHLNSIGPYNVLKVTVAIDGFEDILGEDRGLVPLMPIENLDAVFERCYTVGN